MIVTYDESLHNRKIKNPTKNRSTTQTFLYSKETGELVAVQCNVCGQVKSMDEFRKPTKSRKLHYKCLVCEKKLKKEERGYGSGYTHIYIVTFSSKSIYIGQTKGLKGRISTHISDLKRGNHCGEILDLYNQQPEKVIDCFENYEVLKSFDIDTPKDIVDEYEYELQIDYHKRGYKVLGRQSGDLKFLQYLVKTKRIENIFDCIK